MDCREASSLLQAVLDREIELQEIPELGEHLASCQRCSAELAAMRSIETLVAGLQTISPRTDLTPRILAELGFVPGLQRRVRSLILAACGVVGAWVAALVLATSISLTWLSTVSIFPGGLRTAARQAITSVGKVVHILEVILAPLGRTMGVWVGPYMVLCLVITLSAAILLSKLVADRTNGRKYGFAVFKSIHKF